MVLDPWIVRQVYVVCLLTVVVSCCNIFWSYMGIQLSPSPDSEWCSFIPLLLPLCWLAKGTPGICRESWILEQLPPPWTISEPKTSRPLFSLGSQEKRIAGRCWLVPEAHWVYIAYFLWEKITEANRNLVLSLCSIPKIHVKFRISWIWLSTILG